MVNHIRKIGATALGDVYTAAHATPALVGREHTLQQIFNAIQTRPSCVIYVTGAGGTGKTRLIQHVLRTVTADPSLLVASELIDLYHTRNRSVGGLIESFLSVFAPIEQAIQHQSDQLDVDEQLLALARAEQEGLSPAELVVRRRELSRSLLHFINRFTAHRRLVIGLDTAEQLFVARDIAQDRLGLQEERPAVLDWLLHELLPNLQNTIFLIAGRPRPLNLTNELHSVAAVSGHHFLPIELSGLSKEEALQYFDAVAARAAQSERRADQQAATFIQSLTTVERSTIFDCLYDAGPTPTIRPILLALAIDHVVVSGDPLPSLQRSPEATSSLTEQARRTIEVELNRSLVRSLQENQRPADELITMLGWLRKGATAELLAQLTEKPLSEVKAAIEELKNLSIVKVHAADAMTDDRIFLHDEMYDLLQHNIIAHDAPYERQRVFAILEAYYATVIERARQEIRHLYQPDADASEEVLPRPQAVRKARAELQDAIMEDLYYRLQANPQAAFQQYFLYAEEAIASRDEVLWVLLRAELFSFLARSAQGQETNPRAGLRPAAVIADSAVRWVEWLFGQEKFDVAQQIAERLAGVDKDLIEGGETITQIYLKVWLGTSHIYAGKLESAESLLDESIKQLQALPSTLQQQKVWPAVFAKANDSLGYLYAVRTRYYDAILIYAKAIPLWQKVGLTVQHASSLNDRAFVLSKIGRFHTAIQAAKAGLRLREQLGPRQPVGLSMNTLALIELAQYDFAGGLRDAQRAEQIFRQLESFRGLGLALIAKANALRRNSNSVNSVQVGKSATMLEEAVADATEAVQIFSQKIQEPVRLREAYHELATVYSEWARIRQKYPRMITAKEAAAAKYSIEDLAELSQSAFAKALTLTDKGEQFAYIDILFDSALMDYYTKLYEGAPNFASAKQALEAGLLQQIGDLIPDEYETLPLGGESRPKVWYWVQAGQLYLLRGHVALTHWRIHPEDEASFARAIEHYTRSLANFAYFSNEIFQEMRRAQNQIYENLERLALAQKKVVYQYVNEAEQKFGYDINESSMSKFLQERFGPVEVFIYS